MLKFLAAFLTLLIKIVDEYSRDSDRDAGALTLKDKLNKITQKEVEDARNIRNDNALDNELLISPAERKPP